MDPTRIEKIKTVAAPAEIEKIEILIEASAACLKEYAAGHDPKKYNDHTAAERALDNALKKIEEKHFAAPPGFPTLMHGVRFLVDDCGFKLSKSKAYDDAADGKIKTSADGSILESELIAYSVRENLKKITSGSGKLDGIHAEKAAAELEKTKIQVKKHNLEYEKMRGDLILKVDSDFEKIMQLKTFIEVLKQSHRSESGKYNKAVGGKSSKNQLLNELLDADLDDVAHNLTTYDEIEVKIEGGDNDA